MSEKADTEEFDEDIDDGPVGTADDPDVDHLIKGLDSLKRRGVKPPDPAWRRLERYMEDKHTSELLSDFDDYDIGVEQAAKDKSKSAAKKTKPKTVAAEKPPTEKPHAEKAHAEKSKTAKNGGNHHAKKKKR